MPKTLTTDSDVDRRLDDPDRAYRILIADLVGLNFDATGTPSPNELSDFIESQNATFTDGPWDGSDLPAGQHFFYQPNLSTHDELSAATCENQYDAVIAAATHLPENATFPEGGVRIGAGTGNMACACWGGGDGTGGTAPLMNTPSFNSRATAQMVMKSLLKVVPNLDVSELHNRVVKGDFDTGKHLRDHPTEKLEGKRMGIIGYGNIGREVAKLAKAFGMTVVIHARGRHRKWIESEGFLFAETPEAAALGADVLSPHVGLGAKLGDATFANEGLVSTKGLDALNDGAVLINFDRGEVVDADALCRAMESGKVGYAAVDADIFIADNGSLFGPMLPYRPLSEAFPGRIELLPHAAADTEHTSRVDGSKQAVAQLLTAIRYRRVINCKGGVPMGYSNGGVKTLAGVGKIDISALLEMAADSYTLESLRACSETLATILGAVDSTQSQIRQEELIKRHGEELTLAANRLCSTLEELGLNGIFEHVPEV